MMTGSIVALAFLIAALALLIVETIAEAGVISLTKLDASPEGYVLHQQHLALPMPSLPLKV